ncbi:unnamed protein product [Sphenostylis stenocarpa]|uniref:Uncharacterized protein n=1 Tax=Sphenostylis stenocarpa TaxID=92480 RepID=A0AA86SRC1_9FABA|nr:unnamed protein product [Sphenostylis stenocarpa]
MEFQRNGQGLELGLSFSCSREVHVKLAERSELENCALWCLNLLGSGAVVWSTKFLPFGSLVCLMGSGECSVVFMEYVVGGFGG